LHSICNVPSFGESRRSPQRGCAVIFFAVTSAQAAAETPAFAAVGTDAIVFKICEAIW
jgi:hypothetical protein